MRALSIRQPWAWAIITGWKLVENRKWTVHYRGPIAVHASTQIDEWGYMRLRKRHGMIPPVEPATGAIIGVVQLLDIVRPDAVPADQRQWASGPWCWLLADPRPVPPISCPGMLRLWTLPPDVSQQLADAMHDRTPAA